MGLFVLPILLLKYIGMQSEDLKVIFVGILMCSLIFAADFTLGLGAISMLYVGFMLVSYWLTRKVYNITATTIISIILTMVGWMFHAHQVPVEVDVGFMYFVVDYEGIFRIVTAFILVFVGSVLIRQRKKEFELEKLNESLELRILSKTVASETRSKRLERQIEILQAIRAQQADASIKRLDSVICELKELNKLEFFDG